MPINLTKLKNKTLNLKNSIRKDFYDYLSENNFENLHFVKDAVNEVLKTPTELVGCEFLSLTIEVKDHDKEKQDFNLKCSTTVCIKAISKKQKISP